MVHFLSRLDLRSVHSTSDSRAVQYWNTPQACSAPNCTSWSVVYHTMDQRHYGVGLKRFPSSDRSHVRASSDCHSKFREEEELKHNQWLRTTSVWLWMEHRHVSLLRLAKHLVLHERSVYLIPGFVNVRSVYHSQCLGHSLWMRIVIEITKT